MKIKVTQKNIDEGKPADAKCCPIALALKDAGFDKNAVGSLIATVFNPKKADGLLPVEAMLFVNNFDHQMPVKPFEFELELINAPTA